jgi:hypothetical protein
MAAPTITRRNYTHISKCRPAATTIREGYGTYRHARKVFAATGEIDRWVNGQPVATPKQKQVGIHCTVNLKN